MATAVRRSLLVLVSLIASLVFAAVTAPTSYAAESLTASWGADCASIEISSAGWPAQDFVHVRWYASASSPTPGVDGEAYVRVNEAWSKSVDPSKVRGFSYRIIAPDGQGGWIDVTPLKDEAASCVVVLQPYLVSESRCPDLVIAARNFGAVFPYVITTKVNGKVVDTRTVTGDTSFTLPLPYTGATWTVDTVWLDYPTVESGIHHSEGSHGGCPYIPPVEKVGVDGKRLDGASWAVQSCTRWDGDPDWTCVTLLNTPTIGWTDYLRTNIPTEGALGLTADPTAPSVHEITIWETAAPPGYSVNPARIAITNLCGGWHLGDRNTASCTTPVFAFDNAAYEAAGRTMATQKPLRLTNAPDVPVIHTTLPALAKVDGAGATVTGARVIGWSCTRWDNDFDWQCQSLSDYTIDPSDTTFLQRELHARMPAAGTTSAYRPVDHRLVMWESSAPAGYTMSSQMYAVDYACGAWRSITVTGQTEADARDATFATCDSPVLADNTFRWVNLKPTPTPTTSDPMPTTSDPVPTTSLTAPTTSAPAPTAAPTTGGGLPTTGSAAQDVALIAVALLLLGASILVAARLTAAPRGSRTPR